MGVEQVLRRALIAAIVSVAAAQAGPASGVGLGPSPTEESDFVLPSEVLLVDRLIVHGPVSQEVLASLGPAHSMQAVIDILSRAGIPFERDDARLATRDLPPGLVRGVNDLPPGEPFVVPVDSAHKDWMVGVIQGRVPAE